MGPSSRWASRTAKKRTSVPIFAVQHNGKEAIYQPRTGTQRREWNVGLENSLIPFSRNIFEPEVFYKRRL